MKSHRHLFPVFAVAAAALPSVWGAAGEIWVQPMLYVYRNTDASQVAIDGTPVARDAAMRVLGPSAVIGLDGATLALSEGQATWNPGGAPPAALSLVASPTIRARIGQTAIVRCAPATQYMERRADGTFALREIAPDAADAPRFVLTILAERDPGAPDRLRVTCRTEIVTVRDREAVPGVDLDVGRPETSSFSSESRFTTRGGYWSALLCPKPTASDYGVLTLLRIADRTPESTIEFWATAQVTAAGAAAARPSVGHPVGYVLFNGGFSWLRAAEGGVREPTPAEMETALVSALQSQGYRPAARDLPPAIAVTLQSGCVFSVTGFIGGDRSGTSIRHNSFVMISAYDYADLLHRQKTLLWRVSLRTGHGDLDRALPALAMTSGPFLARDFAGARRDSAEIRPQATSTPGSAGPPTPTDFAAQVADAVEVLIAQEKNAVWTYNERYSDPWLMLARQEAPHTPIPPKK